MQGLDDSIIGKSLHSRTVRRTVNALAMEGIYLKAPLRDLVRQQIGQESPGDELHLMDGSILNLNAGLPVLAMVEAGSTTRGRRRLFQMLVQRAAHGDIELLEAATNTKQRNRLFNAALNQGKRTGIPRQIQFHLRTWLRTVIAIRMHIGRRSRKKQPVADGKNLLRIKTFGTCRQQDGKQSGTTAERDDILLANGMKWQLTDLLYVAGYTNHRRPWLCAHDAFAKVGR